MPIPIQFQGRLSIPAVAAPMFLVSNPDLVVEACRAGIIGTFPALNRRSSADYEAWLVEIRERLDRIERETGRAPAPYGVNLIVHKSNPRLQADLEISIKHKVPLIITSLGAVKELVGAVQGYGGLVFHDVINMRHASKGGRSGRRRSDRGLRGCRRACRACSARSRSFRRSASSFRRRSCSRA